MRRKISTSLIISLALIIMLAAPATFAQQRRRSRLGPRGRAILTALAGTGIGAGVGALAGGRRGAAAGALLGGGGATAVWLLKNRRSRRRLGRFGQAFATIGAGTALGAGVGTLVGGGRGAGIGALLGGGGTSAGYLIARRNRRRYLYGGDYGRYYNDYGRYNDVRNRYRRSYARSGYYCNGR
ncbi:MAG TPA: hypothetical protein VF708_01650 [Pyrinomonadaceae bacterium]|jgi:hypothetical protein